MLSPNNKIFSFIIPVYNTPVSYLKECLAGLPSDAETIVVDDGSTDAELLAFLSSLQTEGSARVIRQENRGVSVARNTGKECATGDYVVFVDADDRVDPALFSEAAAMVGERPDVQVFCFTYRVIDEAGKCREKADASAAVFPFSSFAQMRAAERANRSMYFNGGTVWAKIYKREILVGTDFEEGICLAEDSLFNFVVGQKTDRICGIAIPWYSYRINTLSVGHKYDPHIQDKFAKTFGKMKETYLKSGLTLTETDLYPTMIFCFYLEYTLSVAVYNRSNRMNGKEKDKLARQILQSEPYAEALAALERCALSRLQRILFSRLKKGKIRNARRLFLLKQKILKLLYR